MKNFKTLTLTGLGLLIALLASRVPTAGSPLPPGPDKMVHGNTGGDGVASERSRALEAPLTRIGGIWFW